MDELINITEFPQSDNIVMIAGWRQWADAGSISSGLPEYLIHKTRARQIGSLRSEEFYLFQIPGTHDLVRPIVKFDQGYPELLQIPENLFYFTNLTSPNLVIFIGTEPHLSIERYAQALLKSAKILGVKRIIGLGGVYGELPYDKERQVSCIYSQRELKQELNDLAVNFSEYHGGASIGSYICRRAAEQNIEYINFYAFVPTYDFSKLNEVSTTIRLENDFMAWLGVMKRINHLLHLNFDLQDLQEKSDNLIKVIEAKIDDLETSAPELGVREFFRQLSEDYVETPFEPLEEIWEEEIRKLLDKFDSESEDSA